MAPSPQDIEATQRAAAGPLAGLAAHHAALLRQEFPELLHQGRDRFRIGAMTDLEMTPQAIEREWKSLYGSQVPVSKQDVADYARQLFTDVLLQTDTEGVQHRFRDEKAGPASPTLFHVIALRPDLCPSCEPDNPEVASCKPLHPDAIRASEIARFYALSHEIGHLLMDVTGEERRLLDRTVKKVQEVSHHGPVNPKTLQDGQRWRSHLQENTAESFAILRTLQIYGPEGEAYVLNNMHLRRLYQSDQANRRDTDLTSYYPSPSRQTLMDWARTNTEDLRKASLRTLFDLAREKGEPLDFETVADLNARKEQGGQSLGLEAAKKRANKGDYTGTPPYLRNYDHQLLEAKTSATAAVNALAARNPYRPEGARTESVPFGTYPIKTDPESAAQMKRFGEEKLPPACHPAPETKDAEKHPGRHPSPPLQRARPPAP